MARIGNPVAIVMDVAPCDRVVATVLAEPGVIRTAAQLHMVKYDELRICTARAADIRNVGSIIIPAFNHHAARIRGAAGSGGCGSSSERYVGAVDFNRALDDG